MMIVIGNMKVYIKVWKINFYKSNERSVKLNVESI